MKAVVLTDPSKLEVRDVEKPSTSEGEALIRVTHSGICGTDTKIFSGGIPTPHPLIMGHEMSGVLEEGSSADGTKPGDRVLVDPVTFCGECAICKKGQTNLCINGELLGRDIDGGFAEYCVAPSQNIYHLPDDINDVQAPLIQVLTTVLHAFNQAGVVDGDIVAILGLGVTGLMQVQLAKALGASKVICVSRNAHKRGLAEKFGADVSVTHGEEAKKVVMDMTDGIGADMVIESVGHLSILAEAIDLARTGGKIVPFGIYAADEGKLPFYEFYFKELAIINARAAKGEDFIKGIELVRSGAVDLGPLITHQVPFTDLAEAIRLLIEPSDERLKIILDH